MTDMKIEISNLQLENIIANRSANAMLYDHLIILRRQVENEISDDLMAKTLQKHFQNENALRILLKKIDQIRNQILDDPDVIFIKKEETQ